MCLLHSISGIHHDFRFYAVFLPDSLYKFHLLQMVNPPRNERQEYIMRNQLYSLNVGNNQQHVESVFNNICNTQYNTIYHSFSLEAYIGL